MTPLVDPHTTAGFVIMCAAWVFVCAGSLVLSLVLADTRPRLHTPRPEWG